MRVEGDLWRDVLVVQRVGVDQGREMGFSEYDMNTFMRSITWHD